MLHQFKFENFYSFAETVEVSCVLNGQSPKNDLSCIADTGDRLSKLLAVIGPNASGKTNVLKALAFLQWFVADSFSAQQPNDDIPIEHHFFSENPNSTFQIVFDYQGQLYRYELTLNKQQVVYEALFVKTSKLYSYIFKREWDETSHQYNIAQKDFGFDRKEAAKVRQNASLISTAAQYGVELATQMRLVCGKIFTNVNSLGRVSTASRIDELLEVTEVFQRNKSLGRQASDLLCKLDLGLQAVIIKSETVTDPKTQKSTEISVPYGIHHNGQAERQLELWRESSGTQRAYTLLSILLPALTLGGVAVIDELEADLHPDMLVPLLELFINPATNPKQAQLIFSSHSHEILEMLSKDQVLLVEKDPQGNSEAWLLSDMEGVRRDDNLYAKYRSGAYGAVPNL
ncbi:AAA family ATPase [Thiothrix subterranea]|uniref:ATP-binding protein n=1 Tax=Thiothrix subterranea TaxID=2735563 RepID=A0AA51MNF6_9GAMM|nr:ATP-binding protein [Thiothrix subterranea]WML87709.1 ATP-binding protein [Thiothrix subterranea]